VTGDVTIAAIATPVGTASIGVVRISGPDALSVARRLAIGTPAFAPRTAVYCTLKHPDSDEHLDSALVTYFASPASYTGEDVVEISCHGGIPVIRAVLDAVIACGARLAEPGEFTKRAFLNGKMDLAQAEAVNDLIRSRSDSARKIALDQIEGSLSTRIKETDFRLVGVLAAIEAAIDFPDDVEPPVCGWIESEIVAAAGEIDRLIASFGHGRVYREGLRMVIAGKVNVGKSSLMNALLDDARSIVTPIPGTTRDIIEESLQIRGIPLVAVDTAGIRTTDDPIEKLGVELAEKSLRSADIVLWVFDINEGVTGKDVEALTKAGEAPVIVVLNKVDLCPEEAVVRSYDYLCGLGRSFLVVRTSVSSGEGIDQLEDAIAAVASAGDVGGESVLVTNARHKNALLDAAASLEHAKATLSELPLIDLLSVDISAASRALGLVTGETASDDLLTRIFSEFCIGK
jgi:tRNA modification GTPase